MARVIGVDHPKFQDRGYIFRKPTELECREMGWHWANINLDILTDFDRIESAARWIKATVWWQDFVLFPYGTVYFKHERDLLLFKLKFS